MCFHFGLPESLSTLTKRFKRKPLLPEGFQFLEHYNGFSHPENALITVDQPDSITTGHWGLLPQWAHDTSFRKNTLNARIETVTRLPSFKDCTENRCLILASRFYDWRHEGKLKIPYTVISSEHDEGLFAFAGLYSDWSHPENGEKWRTFTILTTEANSTMQFVHNTQKRMPVILHQTHENDWLQGASIADFAFPYSCELLALAR